MVERSLSMREALGSMPSFSIFGQVRLWHCDSWQSERREGGSVSGVLASYCGCLRMASDAMVHCAGFGAHCVVLLML